jgi:hypothetical protein
MPHYKGQWGIANRFDNKDRAPHKSCLFYSNHRPEDAPFAETLQGLAMTNSNFRFVATARLNFGTSRALT